MLSHLFKKLSIILSLLLASISFNHTPALYAADTTIADVEQLDFANGLFKRELYDMATNEYNKFISFFPESSYIDEAYFGIAESRFFAKSHDEAIESYEKYIELFPEGSKNAIANLRIGQILFILKEYDKALSRFDQIKVRELDNKLLQILYYHIAKAYRKQNDKRKAFQYYKNAASTLKDTDYVDLSFIEIGDMFAEDREYLMAGEYYTKAIESSLSKKTKSLALYKKAEIDFALRDYQSAILVFKQLLDKYPKSDIASSALANLLLCLFDEKEYGLLVKEYQKYKKISSKKDVAFDIHYLASSAYLESGQYEKGIRLIDNVLEFDFLTAGAKKAALIKKAQLLLKSGDFNNVIALVKKNINSYKKDAAHLVFLEAEAWYGLKKFDKAYSLYDKIQKEFPLSVFKDDALYSMAYSKNSSGQSEEAAKLFIDYYKNGKDSIKQQEALYKAILLEIKLGANEKAIEYSRTFLSDFKDSHLTENILFGLGSLYAKLKVYKKAADTLRKFTDEFKSSPKLLEAYFLTGYNLQLIERYDDALSSYSKLKPEKTPKKLFYSALKNTALIYLRKNEDAFAAEIFYKIISDYKDCDLGPEAFLWLAKYYLTNESPDKVLIVLKDISSKDPIVINETAYLKAEAYKEKGDLNKAIKNYDILLSSKVDDLYKGPARLGKGISLSRLEKYKPAKKELETAISENPDDNTVAMRSRFELANIDEKEGNLEEASKLYMLVAVLYNDNVYCPRSLLRAGNIFKNLGKAKEAKKAYQEIIDSYKKSDYYNQAKKRISEINED